MKIWYNTRESVVLALLLASLLLTAFFPASMALAAQQKGMQRHLVPAINLVAQQTLQNIAVHGWNVNAQVKGKTTGGLFVNWQMDNPARTNLLYALSQDDTSGSHDIQTDLLHLNNLLAYAQLNPQDHGFDLERARTLPLVKLEYANYNIPKGWVYFYLLRGALWLGDGQLLQEAYNAANNYYNHWYDPQAGFVYNRSHSPGVVTVEHSVTCGVALIDAGKRWNRADWLQAGISTLSHIVASAYNVQSGLFYNALSIQNSRISITNEQAKSATQGSIAEALSEAYLLTRDPQYFTIAGRVLQGLLYSSSLWDATYGGLNFAYDLDAGRLEQGYKETRAQTHTLIAIVRYNQAAQVRGAPSAFLDRQQQLTALLTGPFYQPTYHGFFYRLQPNFQLYTSGSGHGIGYENVFTTEAMGLAIDALQQLEMPQLTF